MTVSNPNRYLSTSPDDQALALKKYMGSFVEAPRSGVFLFDTGIAGIERRIVDDGKSYQFLMQADKPPAEEFEPGNEILGQKGATAEGTIAVDKFVVASDFVREDDMAIGHYEIIPKLAQQHKRTIAQKYDARIFNLVANAARTAAVTKNGLTVHNGGNLVTRTGGTINQGVLSNNYALSSTGAANFRADLRSLGYTMDNNFIPGGIGQRTLFIPPYMQQVVLYDNTAQVFSRDYIDGENNIQKRRVTLLEGFTLETQENPVQSSANGPFPNQNIQTNTQSKYNGNFTIQAANGTPAALALCGGMAGQAAVGLITWKGIESRVIYQPEKLGWLLYSYILCGADVMHPWCAGSVECIV